MKGTHLLTYIVTLIFAWSIPGCTGHLEAVTNGKIVFQSDRDGNYNLWIMNPDGSDLKNLTNLSLSNTGAGANVDPVPSPDGKQIAFESTRDGNGEIYVVDIETKVQQNVTKNKANDYSPAWSPDGKNIAFVSDRDAVLVDPGRGISTNDIYITNVDGSNTRRLTMDNVRDGYNGLAWSPDAMKLAFSLYVLNPAGGSFPMGISVMDLSNSNHAMLSLTSDPMSCCARWSPDGNHILYSVVDRGFENIYEMEADGTDRVALTHDSSSYDIDPSWSPDGRYVLFSSNRDGQYHIYLMNVDGSNQQRLTGGPGEDRYPVWLPGP